MSDTTPTFTLEQIREHQTKKDLWMVIHDKVYSISSFVDEHPGGEEVLMDVAGVDATEAFEDVGHSDEAREILTGLFVGNLEISPSDKKPAPSASKPTATQSSSANAGVAIYGFFALAAVGALVAYKLYA